MDQDSRWCKRCNDLYRIPRSWLFLPEEELEPTRRELHQLAEAGCQWAAGDKHPWGASGPRGTNTPGNFRDMPAQHVPGGVAGQNTQG